MNGVPRAFSILTAFDPVPGLMENPLTGQTGDQQHGNHRTLRRPECV
jgi:hypothetical protein